MELITGPKNIIIKMPNWLGDAVMGTPLLEDLKKAFPNAKLTALSLPAVADMLAHNPFLDEIISYKKPSGWIHRAEHHDVIDALEKGSYDAGVLLTNSFSSAWWFWRGKVQKRIGFAKLSRSWLLNYALPFPKNLENTHLVCVYKQLLAPFGLPISETKPKLFLCDGDLKARMDFYKLNGIPSDAIVVGINPGASYGSAKCWLPERFREVTQKLIEDPRVVVLFFGDNTTKELIKGICHDMPPQVVNLAGRTHLRELMALIAGCSVFLTNDSGPMHIASAFNVPLLALFGSTNAVKTGPYNGGLVIDKKAACSPCYKRVCPIDFRCMTKITADEVYQQLYTIIHKQDIE